MYTSNIHLIKNKTIVQWDRMMFKVLEAGSYHQSPLYSGVEKWRFDILVIDTSFIPRFNNI